MYYLLFGIKHLLAKFLSVMVFDFMYPCFPIFIRMEEFMAFVLRDEYLLRGKHVLGLVCKPSFLVPTLHCVHAKRIFNI
jgi:hypothetical protein